MVNLSAFLNTQNQVLSNKRTSYVKANILDLTKQANRGTATVRIIADKTGIPMQTVKGVFQVYETLPRFDEKGQPVYNEDGTQATRFSSVEIPYASNYDGKGISGVVKPSEAQLAKLNKLTDLIQRYTEFINDEWITQDETETNIGVKYRTCMTSFWAKVFSVVPTGGSNIIEEPGVYLCKHTSGKFVSTFNDICNQQKQARGEENAAIYLNKFVSNEPGKYDASTTISTLLGVNNVVGYSVAISLMDGLKEYELTNDDISQCEELSTIGWNFKQFDDRKVDSLIERFEKAVALGEKKVAEYNGASVVETSAETSAPVENANPFSAPQQSAPVNTETTRTAPADNPSTTTANDSNNPFANF